MKKGPKLNLCKVLIKKINSSVSKAFSKSIGPLHDPVSWYGINYTGTQITQWDFQNKGKSGLTGTSSSVLEVPLRNLRPSVIYSVPCDRIVQRAYCYQNAWQAVTFRIIDNMINCP